MELYKECNEVYKSVQLEMYKAYNQECNKLYNKECNVSIQSVQ